VSDIERLATQIGHRFEDAEVLLEALTHASYRNENRDCERDNERMEFLGDAVLGAVMSHRLADTFPDAHEGTLTRYKAVLVSELGLAQTARELDLGDHLRLGKGEEASGGREKDSVLANAMEAVFAAVYLDGGYEAVFELVGRVYGGRLAAVGGAEERLDFKTKLQERVQAEQRGIPTYDIIAVSGPDHERRYEAVVHVGGEEVGRGTGRSKKLAEQAAASAAYGESEEE